MAMEYKKDAVAFLNVSLVSKSGATVKLPKGLALRADGSAVEQKILELWLANPDHEFTVVAEVKSAEKSTAALDGLEF